MGGVEVGEVEAPGALRGGAKEGSVESVEDTSFVMVIGERGTFPVEDRDGVTTSATGCQSMEVPSVLVAIDGKPYFGSSLPVVPTFLDGDVQGRGGEVTKTAFKGREGAIFFNKVEKGDDNAAVSFPLGEGRDFLGPSFTGDAAAAEPGN